MRLEDCPELKIGDFVELRITTPEFKTFYGSSAPSKTRTHYGEVFWFDRQQCDLQICEYDLQRKTIIGRLYPTFSLIDEVRVIPRPF